MKTLALIMGIVFLAGCISQTQTPDTNLSENTTPPSTTPEIEPSENVSVTSPKTYDVAIRNFVYSLTITTIKVGDSVKWTNYDVNAHTATADDGSFDTGVLNKDESKTIFFNTIGTYAYHCAYHPWMIGKIVVK